MTGHWIAVACADHVRCGVAGGFMQVCHGKAGPLRRIQPGDGVAYYSPSTRFGGGDRLQSFTAIGRVRDGEPYRFDMGNGFVPFRRDVIWRQALPAPVRPLTGILDFTRASNWGYQLRFGLLAIGEADFCRIAAAMGVTEQSLAS